MLAVTLLALLAVVLLDRQISRRRARHLRQLAEQCGFRYSRVDRFGLARRIRQVMPASSGDVVVRDLMYRSADGVYDYAFTAVYVGGPCGAVVLHARESGCDSTLHDVRRSDPTLPLGEQYCRLLHALTPGEA